MWTILNKQQLDEVKSSPHLWDCLAVNINTCKVRVLKTSLSLKNAEAFNRIAVYRRGVDEEFFVEVPAGSFNDGDTCESVCK